MAEKEYAYIRVSSRDQNEDRQKIAMVEYGIAPGNIYMDKQSGKDLTGVVTRTLFCSFFPTSHKRSGSSTGNVRRRVSRRQNPVARNSADGGSTVRRCTRKSKKRGRPES